MNSPSYLIIDVRDGGCDGYYGDHADAFRIRDHIARRHGHNDFIVVMLLGPDHKRIGDRAFLANRWTQRIGDER